MTKGLEELLNLPPLDEVLRDQGVEIEEPEAAAPVRELTRTSTLDSTDHADSMDGLHDEIVQHARDLMAYGYNIDMPRQRGIFEIAAAMYGHALTSKNSKRDAQLKAMKLMLDRRKVDLEEKRTNHAVGQEQAATVDIDGVIVVEDRNELLRRLRQQIKDGDDTT